MTATLHVDLNAFANNLREVRAVVSPAEVMLVVKDDAYGHGVTAVVRRAAKEGITWFGAFDVTTGRAVRAELGNGVRIFVWMAASQADVAGIISEQLEVGIGDEALLEDVAQAAASARQVARVHLKIDTGLHRNGIRPENWPGFVARAAELQRSGSIEVIGVWSHIAEASDDEDDAARMIYDNALSQAAAAGLTIGVRHLAASAASFARPEFRYDLVRVGAFCYGIRSAGGPSEKSLGLTVASRLEAEVTAVDEHEVTVEVGSLDGLPSLLAGRVQVGTANGSHELLRVGDTQSFVARWPDAGVGDTVRIYGPGDLQEASPTDLAEAINTIGEEIALRVSPLIPRMYSRGEKR
ncbi:alanine racemase [Microbacterium sp. NPDC076911]|uniref:alanine racemase n=1 Tax=Microbacterium sp. NPDC076911 TaxID=3154958 RepID=UPI003425563D